MSKYGQVALLALQHARRGINPVDAWKSAAEHVFIGQPASQEKNCPRCTFLGLIDGNLIAGVAPGNYTKSRANKQYAMEATRLLVSNPTLCESPNDMWIQVMAGKNKAHNAQMDVVAALWKNGDIQGPAVGGD